MNNFKIITDSTSDLPMSYIQEHNLGLLYLSCMFEGVMYNREQELDYKMFYDHVRHGSLPTTSQVNPEQAKEAFTEYLEESNNLLYIAFSSGLSGTYNSGRLAAEEIMDVNPDCNIIVIDSLCASLGEGLLVHKAVMMKAEGKSMEETADWVIDHRLNLVHAFTVDDLNHLYRGGRVSKTAAFFGTLANIKPIMHVDDVGHLIPLYKVRGRKKSLHSLVDYMEEHMGSYKTKNDTVFISHGDALEDALIVKEDVESRFGVKTFLIDMVGPVIGSHSGPGTMALFFLGETR